MSGGCWETASFRNQKILHEDAFFGGSNKHCRSQPAAAKIHLLVPTGEVENLSGGDTWAVPRGAFCRGKERFSLEAVGLCCKAVVLVWGCWGPWGGEEGAFRWG